MIRCFYDPISAITGLFRSPDAPDVPSPREDARRAARTAREARAAARRRAQQRRGTASTLLTAPGTTTSGVLTARPGLRS